MTAGISGSLLVFHHELDAWLNPQLHRVIPTDQRAALNGIANTIESRYPHLVVGYFLFNDHPAASLHIIMNPREAALDGRLDRDTPRPTEVYADPFSGRILGERNWGEIGWSSAHVMPMIYRFHMSLFLGKVGQWITGVVAFFLSGVLDNLTTALIMGSVALAVGAKSPKFVAIACVSIVVAANAGGAFTPFGDIRIRQEGFYNQAKPSEAVWGPNA